MNTAIKHFAIAWALLMVGTWSICAQNGLRGHWRGAVDTPGTSLDMEVDLDQVKVDWIGSIAIPAQNAIWYSARRD